MVLRHPVGLSSSRVIDVPPNPAAETWDLLSERLQQPFSETDQSAPLRRFKTHAWGLYPSKSKSIYTEDPIISRKDVRSGSARDEKDSDLRSQSSSEVSQLHPIVSRRDR